MTHRFFPETFDNFSYPWSIADWGDRDSIVDQLAYNAQHRIEALYVLEQCLSFAIIRYADTWENPADLAVTSNEIDEDDEDAFVDDSIIDVPYFDDDRFKQFMPTIGDITWENLQKGITDKRPFTAASTSNSYESIEDFINETGQQLRYVITHDLIEHVIQWFEKVFTTPAIPEPDTVDDDKSAFVALLKNSAPHIAGHRATRLLGAIWLIDDRKEAHTYFTRLENTPNLPAITREYAAQLRRSIEIESGLKEH